MSTDLKRFEEATSWDEVRAIMREDADRIRLGGGTTRIERQHQKGRLTARERIAALVDDDAEFFEVGLYAAEGMYRKWGGAPGAGVVTGIGRVEKKLFMIVANDATVKAGAFFPMTVKKVLRAQRIAMDNCLPLIYLVDSAGAFLPLQDEVFPDVDDFGRIFRNNARMSARGIAQIAAIMGNCVAGGAYLPVMCDKLLMTDGSGLYIGGPSLVKAAIGQELPSEELGGAELHAQLSGTIDFREKDDPSCIRRLRQLARAMAAAGPIPFARREPEPASRDPEEIYDLIPLSPEEYDTREVLECIVDAGEIIDYKAEYGRTLICGYARVGGFSVGVVANQKQHIREPGKPFEVGGVVYTESADKAARFIMDCNQNHFPILFFQDVNGFMVGRTAEISGIIKSGAKMVNAVANSVVPKITVIMGGSYGAGHYALCGKAYDPRLILAWPTCRYAVMGAAQAARTLTDLRVRQLEQEGNVLDEEGRQQVFREIEEKYLRELDPRYGAARLWLDGLIAPHRTRDALILALEVASLRADIEPFKTGVLQV